MIILVQILLISYTLLYYSAAFESQANYEQGTDNTFSDINQVYFSHSGSQEVQIRFTQKFDLKPQVLFTINKLHWESNIGINFLILAQDVTEQGFKLVYQVFSDQSNFHCQVQWIAFDDNTAVVFYKSIVAPSELINVADSQVNQIVNIPITNNNMQINPDVSVFIVGFSSQGKNNQARIRISSKSATSIDLQLSSWDYTSLQSISLALLIGNPSHCNSRMSQMIQPKSTTVNEQETFKYQLPYEDIDSNEIVPIYGISGVNIDKSQTALISLQQAKVNQDNKQIEIDMTNTAEAQISYSVCQQRKGKQEKDGKMKDIIIGVLVGVGCIILIFIIYKLWKKCKQPKPTSSQDQGKGSKYEMTSNQGKDDDQPEQEPAKNQEQINMDEYRAKNNQNDKITIE